MIELGWTAEQFWNSTPNVYFTCLSQWKRRQRREDYRAGIVVSTIQNILKDGSQEPSHPFDCFPEHQTAQEKYANRKLRRLSAAQQIRGLQANAKKGSEERRAKKRAARKYRESQKKLKERLQD